jgi:hypothetical protein
MTGGIIVGITPTTREVRHVAEVALSTAEVALATAEIATITTIIIRVATSSAS